MTTKTNNATQPFLWSLVNLSITEEGKTKNIPPNKQKTVAGGIWIVAFQILSKYL